MTYSTNDVAEAARLVQYGTRPTLRPAPSQEYSALVRRYRDDEYFQQTVLAVCTGLDLVLLDVDDQHGIVLGSIEDSVFALRMSDYARRMAGQSSERVLHALAHLGAAAMAFPRPADLADPSYATRVTVRGVEQFVREACDRLAEAERERVEQAGGVITDVAPDRPDLKEAWRAYRERREVSRSTDGRRTPESTTGMVAKALEFLADQGLLRRRGDEDGGTYSITSRYAVQVRDAAGRMFGELISLGITDVSDGRGSLVRVEWSEQDLGLF